MQSHKLAVKLFAKSGTMPDIDLVVPIFHKWIQAHAVEGHMLVDVADYKHVQDGPGAVLVSHEANFSTDQAHGRPGLLYNRKQPYSDAFNLAEITQHTLVATIRAAQLLERDTTARFETGEILFRIHDRLHAPNTAETFVEVKHDLQEVFTRALGGPVTFDHEPNSQTLFEVTIKSSTAPTMAAIADRLATAAA